MGGTKSAQGEHYRIVICWCPDDWLYSGVSKTQAISQHQLQGFRLIESFQKVLKRVSERHRLHASWQDPRRRLQLGEYLSLFLFGLVNPALKSMRSLCLASRFEKVRECAGGGACSPSTFSEMQHLIDLALLEDVFQELAAEAQKRSAPPGPGRVAWRIDDSSVFNVLRRMDWAYFQTHHGQPQCAVRMHVSLDMVSLAPVCAGVDIAKKCERQLWKQSWEKGAGRVGDRNYSQDYNLLRLLERREGLFVVRLREKQVQLSHLEELPVTEEDRRQGVLRQALANLGKSEVNPGPRVRVIWIQARDGSGLMLATNQSLEEMAAGEVSQLYRQRWQIELFFRWIKCILGCRHFLAESSEGVAIQLYLALIAALLVQLHLGERPNKRMWEALQLYFQGLVSDQELEESLLRESQLREKLRRKRAQKS